MNGSWAETLIAALEQSGVRHFCSSPGSRSTPLALAAAKRNMFVHFDERAMAFYALGLAKSTKSPVAIIVTSGTAVANLFPAVMEASLDFVPLIILSADRPAEDYDSMANQTVDQIKLFGSFVRWHHSLATPDESIPSSYLTNIASKAASHAKTGPVHLNCPFRQPLIDDSLPQSVQVPQVLPTRKIAEKNSELESHLNSIERGLILIGSHTPEYDIEALSKKIKWPIIGDILSSHHKPLPVLESPDAVLQFGDRFISNTLFRKLGRPKTYVHITNNPYLGDPHHLSTHRIEGEFSLSLRERSNTEWYERFCSVALPKPDGDFSDAAIIASLPNNWTFFIGNSLAIRNANAFFSGKRAVFANRGCSGIDGNIATAAGIAKGTNSHVLAVIGDLTLLHDLNSLALLASANVTLLVINNGGGGIFSLLPVTKEKEPTYKKCIETPHELDFEHAAKMFGLTYANPTSIDTLHEALNNYQIVEVKTSKESGKKSLQLCESFL